jgi:cell division protein FtsW (lipid II flippase)
MTTLKFVGKSGWTEPTNYFYFNRQVFYFGLGLLLSWIVYKLPLKLLQQERVVIVIGVGALVLQLLVFTPLGIDLNGAT